MFSALILAAALVQPIPRLEDAGRWESTDTNLCRVSTFRERLEVDVAACGGDGAVRVSLATPAPVPAGADLHFKIMRPKFQTLFLRAVVRDGDGQEFAVWTEGQYHLAKSNAFGGQFRPDIVLMQGGEWRATARLSALARGNCTPIGKARLPAKGELAFVGLEFQTELKAAEPGNKVWLRDFAFSDASYANSKFYYSFGGRQCYGELDGDPKFSGLDVQAKTWGPKHVLEWELCDKFDGRPFLQGERVTEFPDWRCEELQRFHMEFHRRFAERYDKDPRLAFVETGFGLWAEYHIYDGPCVIGKTFPSHEFQAQFLPKMDEWFQDTPWMFSIDASDSKYAPFHKQKALLDLTLEELRKFHPAFDRDVFDDLSMISCVEKRDIPGAPAPGRVQQAIDSARAKLGKR